MFAWSIYTLGHARVGMCETEWLGYRLQNSMFFFKFPTATLQFLCTVETAY